MVTARAMPHSNDRGEHPAAAARRGRLHDLAGAVVAALAIDYPERESPREEVVQRLVVRGIAARVPVGRHAGEGSASATALTKSTHSEKSSGP